MGAAVCSLPNRLRTFIRDERFFTIAGDEVNADGWPTWGTVPLIQQIRNLNLRLADRKQTLTTVHVIERIQALLAPQSASCMDTKNCRGCIEPINASATRCPRCQSFQSRTWMWLPAIFGLIPLLIVFPLIFRVGRLSNDEDVKFVPDASQLTAVNATLKYEAPEAEEGVTFHYIRREAWVYCTVKNSSKHRWENLEFVVEFKNSAGDRVDLVNSSASITSHPNTDLECRIQCDLNVDPKNVTTTKVTVTDARRPYR